jgi:hypothetical protein
VEISLGVLPHQRPDSQLGPGLGGGCSFIPGIQQKIFFLDTDACPRDSSELGPGFNVSRLQDALACLGSTVCEDLGERALSALSKLVSERAIGGQVLSALNSLVIRRSEGCIQSEWKS